MKMRAVLKLVEETQDTMKKQPDCDVELILRARFDTDAEGGISIEAGASAPLTASMAATATGGFSRRWTELGVGEFVLRISRPGSITAAAMMARAEAQEPEG
jgi:hypothetical protein